MGVPVGVGVVGLGAISAQYLDRLAALAVVDIVAVADVDASRAHTVAHERGLPAMSVDELLAHPGVSVVVNLTPPAHHARVSLDAIAAGRSVYTEKPLGLSVAEGLRVLEAADAAGVRVGAAPDTVLGVGIQTARAAIDAGLIGTPTAATASFFCPGHEAWHPNPDFYYQAGGGPLFDMGPYYLTALVALLGPVANVIAAGNMARPTRTITTGPRAGEEIRVDVLTHTSAILTHTGGAISTVTLSFDATASQAPPIELHGPLGSLSVPDPNTFDGHVRIRSMGADSWRRIPPSAGYTSGGRGIGLADMVVADSDDHARASGAMALHVLDVMESAIRSARIGSRVEIEHQTARPAAVPLTVEPSFSA